MKYATNFKVLIAVAALAVSAVVASCAHVVELTFVTARALKNWVLDGFKLAAREPQGEAKPRVQGIRAAQFELNLIERSRPRVTSSWRMCSST